LGFKYVPFFAGPRKGLTIPTKGIQYLTHVVDAILERTQGMMVQWFDKGGVSILIVHVRATMLDIVQFRDKTRLFIEHIATINIVAIFDVIVEYTYIGNITRMFHDGSQRRGVTAGCNKGDKGYARKCSQRLAKGFFCSIFLERVHKKKDFVA